MKLSIAAAGLTLIAGTVAPAAAHSLKSLENQLGNREKYFQPLNKEAPGFELQDPDGRMVRLADFQGKVVVLHFIYINCPDVCPLHAERIAEIQEMVNQTPMRDVVQFVTVTTDPKNDTPEVMRAYGPARGLDPGNWTFLTSGPDRLTATRELVEMFGHKFTEADGGYQVHSVVTHVIDREGRWRANFHGLKFQPTNLVLFINALVNDDHQSATGVASAGDPTAATQASAAAFSVTGSRLAIVLGALTLGFAVGAVSLYRMIRK